MDVGGLYCFHRPSMESSPHPTINYASLSSNDQNTSASNLDFNKLYLWHARLSHANVIDIKIFLNLINIHLRIQDCIELCNSCCLAKSRRLPAPLTNVVIFL